MANVWKKGRGKLGFMQPLLGSWEARSDSPRGPMRCTRVFESILGGHYIRLDVQWMFGSGTVDGEVYTEHAVIGVGDEGVVSFWSFTSDGKRSQGTVADVTELHPSAIGFEAQMPAGLARMAYWPGADDGFVWVVESKNAKGWKRFVQHDYRRA